MILDSFFILKESDDRRGSTISSEQQSAAESGREAYGSDAEGQADQKMGNYTASRLEQYCFSL